MRNRDVKQRPGYGNLVLSRKRREAVVMAGGEIEITVLAGSCECDRCGNTDVWVGNVRLMISAPKDIDVFRKEIWDRMQQEQQQAVAAANQRAAEAEQLAAEYRASRSDRKLQKCVESV